jgi:hypothetical protein
VANPGSVPSTIRVSALSAKGSSTVGTMTVDPGTTTAVTVPATAEEASTYVEYFGGWVAAGWLTVSSASQGTGVGAEPCAPATDSRTWYTANGSTPKGAGANVIIMNPYGANAIFDVVLFAADRAAVRQSDDVVLKPHRSMVVSIQDVFPLEAAVGSEIDVHAGRVGVASVDTSAQNGVGAVLGSDSPVSSLTVPLLAGSGQRSVSVTVPGTDGIRFDGTDLAANVTHPPGLSDAPQDPETAQSYPVTTAGASGLRLVGQQGSAGSFVASVSSLGEGTDFASTGGAPAAGPAWIVLPTVAGDPSEPGLVITDPGTEGATVTLHVLAADGPDDVTIKVAAGSSVDVPAEFLAADETAGVLVTSTGGAVIAAGASESLGMHGIAGYAIAVGIAVPNAG